METGYLFSEAIFFIEELKNFANTIYCKNTVCCIFDLLSDRISKQIALSLPILLHLEEKLLRNLVRKPFSKHCTYFSLALIWLSCVYFTVEVSSITSMYECMPVKRNFYHLHFFLPMTSLLAAILWLVKRSWNILLLCEY